MEKEGKGRRGGKEEGEGRMEEGQRERERERERGGGGRRCWEGGRGPQALSEDAGRDVAWGSDGKLASQRAC